jgi:arylsulfatase
MDGVDCSKFLLGESEHSGRDTLLFFGPDGSLMSVKWHNIKIWLRYSESIEKPIVTPQFPMFFDLGSDPSEKNNLSGDKMDIGWMFLLVLRYVAQYEKSLAQYPNIKPGEEFTGYKTALPKSA